MKKEKFCVGKCNINLSYFGFILLTIGLIFLIDNLNILNNAWGKLWPLILIVIGVIKIIKNANNE
jgi:hypothetical protein